jgi:hypothetical protein
MGLLIYLPLWLGTMAALGLGPLLGFRVWGLAPGRFVGAAVAGAALGAALCFAALGLFWSAPHGGGDSDVTAGLAAIALCFSVGSVFGAQAGALVLAWRLPGLPRRARWYPARVLLAYVAAPALALGGFRLARTVGRPGPARPRMVVRKVEHWLQEDVVATQSPLQWDSKSGRRFVTGSVAGIAVRFVAPPSSGQSTLRLGGWRGAVSAVEIRVPVPKGPPVTPDVLTSSGLRAELVQRLSPDPTADDTLVGDYHGVHYRAVIGPREPGGGMGPWAMWSGTGEARMTCEGTHAAAS